MNRINKLIYICVAVMMIVCSCIKENFNADSIAEGEPALICLGYGSNSAEIIMTKGVMTELDEDRVNSLRVLVFDAKSGLLVTDQTFVGDQLKGKSAADNYSSGYVELATTSGNRKIFGIANLVNNQDFTIDLSHVSNISDLESLTVTQNSKTVSRGANFLMTGWYNETDVMTSPSSDDLKATVINIPVGNSTKEHKRIKLSRLDSKVEFEFLVGNSSIDFTPLSYSVYNVPTMAYVSGYDDETGLAADLGAGYPYDANCFNTTPANFDNASNSNAFGFYMMESNLLPVMSATTFAHRDLKDKGDDVNGIGTGTGAYDYEGDEWNGDWAYANRYSTYVQVKGRIEYKNTDEDFISADAVYNIHLGNFGDSVKGVGNGYNDFSSRRNTHYKYTVTVNGADDIRVEVEEQNERMPAAEGTVVIANGEIFTVDSHYSSRIMKFSRTDFTEEDDIKNLSWYVSTPYSSGMPDNERNYENTLDFKWVEFYPHTSAITSTDSYTSYITYLKSLGATDDTLDDYRIYVDDLVGKLKAWYMGTAGNDFEGAESVYVTAFVNEFYYEKGTGNAPSGGSGTADELRDMWKKVVNADDRYLHILCDVHHSVDGSSLSMGSAYSIFQHSIQTIYNTDPNITDLKVAWGTEMINEEKTDSIMALYGTGGVNGRLYGQIIDDEESVGTAANNKTSYFNGRNNTALIWGDSQPWTNDSNSKVKESAYGPILRSVEANNTANPAVYACMTRNRDNDGDGKIGNSEIRWYLAAIDQYFGILIGEPGISKDAVMYPLNTYNNTDYHYLSSTASTYIYSNNALDAQKTGANWNNGFSFWAEEAGSTSPSDISWEPAQRHLLIRCLRNLGKDSDESGSIGNSIQMYSQFSTKETNGETIGVVTSKYLNPQSLRSKVFAEGEQYGIGDDIYTNNRPHVEFFIAASNSSTTTYDALKTNIEAGNLDDVCPEGWRVPYAKELALMFALIPSDASESYDRTVFIDWSNPNGTIEPSEGTQWLSSTFSRFGYYGSKSTDFADRAAIICNGNGIMTINKSTDTAQVRCVKDNTAYAPQTPVMTLNDGGSGI